MKNIKQRDEKIQEKRKKTSWRQFVKEIGSWNQMMFYTNNGKISRYPETERVSHLVSTKEFETTMNNPENIIDYNPSKTLFENFELLLKTQKLPYLRQFGPGVENCSYSDTSYNARNCYLSMVICFDVENVLYSYHVSGNCKNVLNSVFVNTNSEIVYQSSDVTNSQNVFFSSSINNCYNIRFSHNLIGCKECIACDNLVNKSYCIENIEYTKEEYLNKKQQALGSYLYKKQSLKYQKTNSSLFMCDELENGLFCSHVQTGRNVCFVSRDNSGDKKNLFDTMSSGGAIDGAYGCMGVSPGDNFYCSINSAFCSKIYYSIFLSNCSYCIGCVGLKNKQFCILNKQYTKEERFELANNIFTKMDEDGTLGDFFPASINPFYFNDTAAYLIDDSFNKKDIKGEGYLRRDNEIKVDIPKGSETVKASELNNYQGFNSEGTRIINPDILKKVIIDEKGNYYRIVKLEYDFLVKYGLPIPELHWLDRIKLGFKFK